MTQYVLVEDGTDAILKEVDGDKEFRNGSPPDLPGKPFRWLSLVVDNPPVNHATEVKTGPVVVVSATEYTRTWTVRPKTQTELDAEDEVENENWFELMKPLLKALSNGDFIPGSNYSKPQVKAILKANK